MGFFPGVALVTGGGSGIGANIATEFAKEGCKRIALCDRNAAGLRSTKDAIAAIDKDVKVFVATVDVTVEEQIRDFVAAVVAELGGIHYAVNAAGILTPKTPSTELPSAIFDAVHQVNVRGVWLSAKYELAQMVTQDLMPTHDGRPGERGCIVNLGSQLAFGASPGSVAYISAKAAVVSMTKCDAMDYAAHQIRVNCLCPGCTESPMTAVRGPQEKVWLDKIVEKTPMRRMGTTQEMADAAMFLCSSKASFMHGAAMVVDGGYVIA